MPGSDSPESTPTPTPTPPAPAEQARMSLTRRVGLGLLGLLVLYALVGFLVVPRIVESQLVSFASERFGVTPEVGGVSFDPFRVRLAIEDFALPDPFGGGPVLALEELAIDVGLLGFLSSNVPLDEFLLVAPRISIVTDESGKLNVVELVDRFSASAPSDPSATSDGSPDTSAEDDSSESEPLLVDVDLLRVEDGDLIFEDRSQAPPFVVRVEPFDLLVEGLTTRAEVIAPYALLLRVGEQTSLEWTGRLGLAPLRSEGEIELTGLDLTVPWDYLSSRLRFEVAGGALDASAGYVLDMSQGLSLVISEGAIATRDVEVVDPQTGEATFTLPALAVGGIDVSVGSAGLETLAVADVALTGGHLDSALGADRQFRLVELFEPVEQVADGRADGKSDEEAADGVADGKSDDAAGGDEEAAAGSAGDADPSGPDAHADARAAAESTAPPAAIRVDRLALSDFEIELTDRGPATPVELHASQLALEITGFRNAPEAKLDVALRARLGETGQLAVSGPVVLEPLSTQLAVELKGLSLSDFEPYLEGVAQLDVVKGELSAALDLDVRDVGEASPRVAARGWVAIEDLSTRDRRLEKKFVGWERFALEGVDFGPERLRIEEVVLSGATARLLLDAGGRSNIASIFEQPDEAGTPVAADRASAPAPAKTPPPKQGSPLAIEIGKVTLDRVRADLVDQSIEPPFKISLDEFGGSIEGLSSQQGARASVALAGKVDAVAPLRIDGRVNPLSSDAYTDLELSMSGVSLPAFSPYSGRFVGYRIDRGKLGLDLHYVLEDRHLKAQNLIELQQFDFGQRVPSEQATSLPVGLALTVMKDGSGNITLPVPIEGDLDDPSFDVLQLLAKTLVNLITRVATAPFSVVSGLVGRSAEDLAHVVFEPGRVEMVEGEQAGLADVGTLLAKRPNLTLEIRGRADPEIDGPGLRRARIEESLRERHFDSVSRRERQRLGGPEAVVLDDEQRLAQLEPLYREQIGGRVADRLPGVAGEPPSGELLSKEQRVARMVEIAENALAEQIVLESEDWLELARARAAKVQAILVDGDLVSADRIFLVDPQVGASETPGRVGVELSLGVR